jgi:PIN domain nuclease of toxin-antitoxin system
LLADTHTLLWWLDSLSRTAFDLLYDPSNIVLISPAIPWEIAIKVNTGKLPPNDLLTDFHSVMRKNRFAVIGIDPLHAIRSGLLPFHHRDPFDRLLVAQSLELNVPLISRDAIFDQYGVQRIW